MKINESLLKARKELKERKPDFIRQDTSKRMKLKIKWRKPKGHHSKIRHRFAGRRIMPSPGFKSPIKVRGMHATGMKMIRVHSPSEVLKIKKDSEGIVIGTSVGMKKKLEILQKANEMKITVLNINASEAIKKNRRIHEFEEKAREGQKSRREKRI